MWPTWRMSKQPLAKTTVCEAERSCSPTCLNFARSMIFSRAGRISRGTAGNLAAYRRQKFRARNNSGAALHDHQTAGNVGDVGCFKGRRTASQRKRVRGEDRVAGTCNVDGLVAAV